MMRSAVISDCGRYRYLLSRQWSKGAPLVFCMLNPSTADGEEDDPTVRRCIGFARAFGFGGLHIVNVFPWRATDPKDLQKAGSATVHGRGEDIVSRTQRDRYIKQALWSTGAAPIAAWGASKLVTPHLPNLTPLAPWWDCLGTTKSGAPRHPLYLAANRKRQLWWSLPRETP